MGHPIVPEAMSVEDQMMAEFERPARPENSRSAFVTMQHQLKEALLEIDRHHADFSKISKILDAMEEDDLPPGDFGEYAKQALKDIRNIVG